MKPIYANLAAAVALSFAIAACVPQPAPAPAPVPAPTPAPTPAPPPVVTQPAYDNWMDAPRTPGDWSYRKEGETTLALYGKPETEADFFMRCIPGQRVVILGIAADTRRPTPVIVRTETRDRTFPSQGSTGVLPHIEIPLPASDPLLDAMAISKGRFAIEIPGLETLFVPSWPEVTRVIEDCR